MESADERSGFQILSFKFRISESFCHLAGRLVSESYSADFSWLNAFFREADEAVCQRERFTSASARYDK